MRIHHTGLRRSRLLAQLRPHRRWLHNLLLPGDMGGSQRDETLHGDPSEHCRIRVNSYRHTTILRETIKNLERPAAFQDELEARWNVLTERRMRCLECCEYWSNKRLSILRCTDS